MTEPVVLAAHRWKDNGYLIRDAWRLGYVHGQIIDVTPGGGEIGQERSLWTRRLPYTEGLDIVHNWERRDFRDLPFVEGTFDTVLYDPPYKLNGNPQGLAEMSQRYGVDVPKSAKQRHKLMVDGLVECVRILAPGGFLLAKCQDQVCNGQMHWQTDMFTDYAAAMHLRKVDRFDLLGHSIPQPMGPSKRYPNGRKQKHAHGRPSTLLVFKNRERRA